MTEILLTVCMCVPGIQFFVAKAPGVDAMVKDVIVSNWLSTSGAGDYNGDGICNMEDYAIVTSDYDYYKAWLTLNFGHIWK